MKQKATTTLRRIASLALLSHSFFALGDLPAAKKEAEPKDVGKKTSYIFGLQVYKRVATIFTEKTGPMAFDHKEFLKGFDDQRKGNKSAITEEGKEAVMEAFKNYQRDKHIADNKQFLEENKKKKGIKVTASGLQYKVIKSGPAKGKSPKADWEVSAHYKGKLIDGSEFDASFNGKEPTSNDEPMTFHVGGVIPGWSEALQLMKVGDVWELFIPSELGYGPRPFPEIPAFSTLVFEVRLVEAKEPVPVIEASSEEPAAKKQKTQ